VIRPGRVMYELEGVTEELAKQAFHWLSTSWRFARGSSDGQHAL